MTGTIGIYAYVAGSGTIDITNNGTVTGLLAQAIFVNMGTAGTATLDNVGTINGALNLVGAAFTLLLEDGGTVSLNGQTITAATAGDILENTGNTIAGYGQIGTNNFLTFNNTIGTVDANVAGRALVVPTGHTVINNGFLEASGGILRVMDAVTGSGSAGVAGGGTLELNSAYAQTVTFSGTGGTLILDAPALFTGQITGISTGSDLLDLRGLNAAANDTFATSTSFNNGKTSLTVNDTTKGTSASVTLLGNYTAANGVQWAPTYDNNGGADLAIGSPFFWGNVYVPSQPALGVHIFSAAAQVDAYTGAGGLFTAARQATIPSTIQPARICLPAL